MHGVRVLWLKSEDQLRLPLPALTPVSHFARFSCPSLSAIGCNTQTHIHATRSRYPALSVAFWSGIIDRVDQLHAASNRNNSRTSDDRRIDCKGNNSLTDNNNMTESSRASSFFTTLKFQKKLCRVVANSNCILIEPISQPNREYSLTLFPHLLLACI